jgi:hypothetical protein
MDASLRISNEMRGDHGDAGEIAVNTPSPKGDGFRLRLKADLGLPFGGDANLRPPISNVLRL